MLLVQYRLEVVLKNLVSVEILQVVDNGEMVDEVFIVTLELVARLLKLLGDADHGLSWRAHGTVHRRHMNAGAKLVVFYALGEPAILRVLCDAARFRIILHG